LWETPEEEAIERKTSIAQAFVSSYKPPVRLLAAPSAADAYWGVAKR
jgi:hypothetical protein